MKTFLKTTPQYIKPSTLSQIKPQKRLFASQQNSDLKNDKLKNLINQIKLKTSQAYPYVSLAESVAFVIINDREWTKRDLYLKALELSPNYPRALVGLANTMKTNEEVIEVEGERLNRVGLAKRAINFGSKNWNGYFALAKFSKDDDVIELENGEKFTKKQLLVKAYEYGETNYHIIVYLSELMNNTEKITLHNGEFTRAELLFNTIKSGKKSKVYNTLVKNAPKEGFMINGKQYTKEHLFQLWQHDLPNYFFVYRTFARECTPEDNFTLLDGTTLSYKDVCIKALELEKRSWMTYYYLSNALKDKDEKVVVNGKTYDKKSLLKLCLDNIEYEDHLDSRPLLKLIQIMESNETVDLKGKIYTKKKLLYLWEKRAQINP